MHANCFSRIQPFVTRWAVANQAPLSMGFPRQEYWSGLSCPPPGDLPDPGIEPTSLYILCIGKQFLYHYRHLGSPCYNLNIHKIFLANGMILS